MFNIKSRFLKFSLPLFLLVFLFIIAPIALAGDSLGTGFIDNDIVLSGEDPRGMITQIINIALSILGIIAVGIVIYGGFVWMMSEGNEEKVTKAKNILKSGLIGLAIILSAWGIASFVLQRLGDATGIGSGGDSSGNGTIIIPGTSGAPCGSVFSGVCSPDNVDCNSGLLCHPNSCTCVPEDDDSWAQLGDPCYDGNTCSDASNNICNPSHGLTCSPLDCTCVGSPVITEISPVGGFCVDNINTPCLDDSNCPGSSCDQSTPNAASGNFVSIFGYNFDSYGSGSAVSFIPAGTGSTWSCGSNISDSDGNTYGTVAIGSQCWITENLKTTKYNDGVDIPEVGDNNDWKDLNSGAYSWYENNSSNKNTHGALYNFYSVQSNKLCPSGWRVPSDNDWYLMEDLLESGISSSSLGWRGSIIKDKLISGGSSGFQALFSGNRYGNNGSFFSIDSSAYWWTSTVSPIPTAAYYRLIIPSGNPGSYRSMQNHKYGFSVRCVQDLSLGSGIAVTGQKPSELNSDCLDNDSWTNTQIIVALPSNNPFSIGDDVDVEVVTKNNETNNSQDQGLTPIKINSIARPGLCLLSPDDGKMGEQLWYYGINMQNSNPYFGSLTSKFSGIGTINFSNNLAGTAGVPNVSTGKMSTFLQSGLITSNFLNFKKLAEPAQGPSISFFDPPSGAPGQYVTIFGSGFGNNKANSMVSFGSEDASFNFPPVCLQSVWSNSQIIVKVPDALPDGSYQINVDIGSWPTITANNSFVASSSLALLPGLCKISPGSGPSNSETSLWGEYFGTSPLAVFSSNQVTGALTVNDDQGADKVSTNVPPNAVTGAVKIRRGTVEGNSLNFSVGSCSAHNDCVGLGGHCCLPGTDLAGSCTTDESACFTNISPSSFLEWSFSTGFATTTITTSTNMFSCNMYNSCPAGNICPNSIGYCSPYAGGKTASLGTCLYNCPSSSFPFCASGKCEYNDDLDRCTYYQNINDTEELECSLNLNKMVEYDLGFGTTTTMAECKSYSTSQGVRHYYEIQESSICPTIGGLTWSLVSQGKCVDTASLGATSTCQLCPAGSTCLPPDPDNTNVVLGVCASEKLCSGDFACGSDSICSKVESASCQCCCDVGENTNSGNPACCAPLICDSSYACGISNNINATSTNFGFCSGCNIPGLTPAEKDSACNCLGIGGKYCEVTTDYPDGACLDCTVLSKGRCMDHPGSCCWDEVNSTCRGGASDESVWGVGAVSLFPCGQDMEYNGDVYSTVEIGGKCWFAENLNTTKYNDGASISNITNGILWQNATVGAYSCYANSSANCNNYGALYNYKAVESNKLCPLGWRVSTDEDWKMMEIYFGHSGNVWEFGWRGVGSGSILAGGTWPSGQLTGNSNFGQSGLNALPGGQRYYFAGNFLSAGLQAYFWSPTNYNYWNSEVNRIIGGNTDQLSRDMSNKKSGLSVRCVEDYGALSPIGYCPYYRCDPSNSSTCAITQPAIVGDYSSISDCENSCPQSCANRDNFLDCVGPGYIDSDHFHLNNQSSCCWDYETNVCLGGDRYEAPLYAGFCKYYKCSNPPSCGTSRFKTGAYTSQNACNNVCSQSSSGMGVSCFETGVNYCTHNSCNPLSCLNAAGSLGVYDPNNANSCGTCCCDPDANQCELINDKLMCVANKGNCTGNDRGLCCGCESDSDCSISSQALSVGCGFDTCCHARPEIASTSPSHNSTGVCRNAAIEINFDQIMEVGTLINNIFLLEESDSTCPAGTYYIGQADPFNNNFLAKTKRFFSKAFSMVSGIFGKESLAFSPDDNKVYCAVLGTVDFSHGADNKTSAYFKPNSLLKANKKYFILVKGDVNLDSTSGVKSFRGIGMNGTTGTSIKFNNIHYTNSQYSSFETLSVNTPGQGICEIDYVAVSPASYLFQSNINDNNENDTDSNHLTFDTVKDRDKAFSARARSSDHQILQPVSGVYDWNWNWTVENNSIIDIDSNPASWVSSSSDKKLIRVKDNITDGRSEVRAQVSLTTGGAGNGTTGKASAYILICNNPWPAVDAQGNWAPWRDSTTYFSFNHEFYYCRDSGSSSTADDLPAFLNNMDQGSGYLTICSNNPSQQCTSNNNCPSGGVCLPSFFKETYFFKEKLPKFVENITVTDLETGGALQVSWGSDADLVNQYKIYYNFIDGSNLQSILVMASSTNCNFDSGNNYNTCSADLTGLTNGQMYAIRITALSANMAETNFSDVVIGEPSESGVPNVPANLQAVALPNKMVRLSWTAPPSTVSKYRVYRGVVDGVYGTAFYTNDSSTTTIMINLSTAPQNEYYFAVSALDSFGAEGSKSSSTFVDISPCGVGYIIDNRDSKQYSTVKIGNQCWMKENLAYLPEVHSNSEFISKGSNYSPGYGVYGYNGSDIAAAKSQANYFTYGVLYNWYAVDQANICPAGWKVPGDNDLKSLEMFLGMSQIQADGSDWRGVNEGSKLAGNISLWASGVLTSNGAFGLSGFMALPGGSRGSDGSFSSASRANLWSSSQSVSNTSWMRYLTPGRSQVGRGALDIRRGNSVRCLLDD